MFPKVLTTTISQSQRQDRPAQFSEASPQNSFKMFENFFSKLTNLLPRVHAEDDELIDPQVVLKEQCRDDPHVKPLIEKYEACNDRVNSRSQTTETCVEELFDLLHAIDHCVTPKLFPKLK